MTPAFWRGRRVLLTGHTGFKGGWLALWLQGMGAEVRGYALAAPSEHSLFESAHVAQGMRSEIGDIRDLGRLRAVLGSTRPEVVIHMAAQSLVRRSYVEPVETYATNVMGTVHLLEAVREAEDVRVVLNVTSDKCYENREWVWGYRESDPMGGHDPYSSSKGCAELVTAAYRRSYFDAQGSRPVALASVRAGNVIGGGDWAEDRLVPDLMRAFIAGRPAVIRNPLAVRPWQHVLEPLRGYLMLAESLWSGSAEYREGWNFGPEAEDTQNVGWIADRLAARWGEGARWERDPDAQPHEAQSLRLDCSKARTRLYWQPVLGLGEALDWVVDWYRAYRGGADMRRATLEQIEQYSARVTQ